MIPYLCSTCEIYSVPVFFYKLEVFFPPHTSFIFPSVLTADECLIYFQVLKNNSDGSEIGSLLQIMNRTLTIFGSRLLRHWVWGASIPHTTIECWILNRPFFISQRRPLFNCCFCMIQVSHPLCDQTLISARLHAVSEIAQSMGSCNSVKNLVHVEEDPDVAIVQPELAYTLSLVLTTLGRAPDIQRGITRIFHCTATPSEVINGFLLACFCISHFHYILFPNWLSSSSLNFFPHMSFIWDRETERELIWVYKILLIT